MSINKRCAISNWRSGLESARVSCAFTLWEPNNTPTQAEDNDRGATPTEVAVKMRRQSCLENASGSWGMASDYLTPSRRRCRLLGRERGDDLIKARIAAQRVPNRIETQLAVT